MVTRRTLMTPAGLVAFVLGQASTWWGLAIVLAYDLGFAILLPHAARPGMGGGLALPLEPPIVGLALGGLGLWIARRGGQPSGYCVAGLVLNAVALAFAVALWAGGPR